jgi:hypothetical protein
LKKSSEACKEAGDCRLPKTSLSEFGETSCSLLLLDRSSCRYKARRRDDSVIRIRIRDIAQSRVRYGYKRIHENRRLKQLVADQALDNQALRFLIEKKF